MKEMTLFLQLLDTCKHQFKTYIPYQHINTCDHVKFIQDLKACGEVVLDLQFFTTHQDKRADVVARMTDYMGELEVYEEVVIEMDKPMLISSCLDDWEKFLNVLTQCGQLLSILPTDNTSVNEPDTDTPPIIWEYGDYSKPIAIVT